MSSRWWQQLRQRLAESSTAAGAPDPRLATAVLLHEVAHADLQQDPKELAQISQEMAAAFGLDAAEAEALRQQAADTARNTVSLHALIDVLNRSLDAEGRRALVARLWRVAYADGSLDPHEEALIRRLADLLHVPHAVFVQERLRAAGRTS